MEDTQLIALYYKEHDPMKRKMFFPIVMFGFVLIAVGYNLLASYSVILTDSTYINLSNIEALAQDESNNGYSCTVTVDCGDLILAGSVSCTGKSCNRGLDWSKGAYVECDGI